jgi:hypothetical protein
MTAPSTPSPAELADRSLRILVAAMFALAAIFCLSVAQFFATDSAAAFIDLVVKALGIVIVVLMATLYFWKFRPMTSGQRRRHFAEDGFLQIGFRKAMAQSWMLTFLVLVVLQALDELVLARLPEMPVEIVVKAVLALMLVLFSAGFLVLTRTSDDHE